MRKSKIKAYLHEVCTRYLWRALPCELEDKIIHEALRRIPEEDIDASPYGPFFELVVTMVECEQGYGTFVTIYDESVTIEDNVRYGFLSSAKDAFEQYLNRGFYKTEDM